MRTSLPRCETQEESWEPLWESGGELDPAVLARFGELVAGAAAPIDDVRGSAAYRRHSLSVMARRAATWAWNDLRKAA